MNPWIILGVFVALIAVGLGGEIDGNERGTNAERVTWQQRENKELVTANAKILTLEEAARAAEKKHAEEQNKIAVDYEEKLANAKKQKDADVAAARNGRISLRIPAPRCQDTNRGDATEAAAAARRGDGGASAELPRETAADLLGLADDADSIVAQLTACQRVVREDRR